MSPYMLLKLGFDQLLCVAPLAWTRAFRCTPSPQSPFVLDMGVVPFVGPLSLGKWPLTSTTEPAQHCTNWEPGWLRGLARNSPQLCPSLPPILMLPTLLLPLLHRLRELAKPTCCPLKRSRSLASRGRRHPGTSTSQRVVRTGPRHVPIHRLVLLRLNPTGPR